MISLLTVTKDHFEAFSMCEHQISPQLDSVDEWLVADLGDTPVELTSSQNVFRMPPDTPYDAAMRKLITEANYDKVLIIQDTTWYPSDYVGSMAQWLDHAPLVAFTPVHHYRLNGAYSVETTIQPNLAAVGIRLQDQEEAIRFALRSSGDCVKQLWDTVTPSLLVRRPGIVMLWGLPGVDAFPADLSWTVDKDGSVLRQWVGDVADVYTALGQQDGAMTDIVELGGVAVSTFRWKGVLMHQCPDCQFDAQEIPVLLKHWRNMHGLPQQSVAPGPLLFDADDRPIEREVYGGINI